MKKTLLAIIVAFITLIAFAIHYFSTSSLVITNETEFEIIDVRVFKPRESSAEIKIWQGQIAANSSQKIRVPGGGSDDVMLVQGAINGAGFVERFGFSAIGGETFVMTVKDENEITVHMTPKLRA